MVLLFLEVDQGRSAHPRESPAQCASKASPLKPTCGVTLTRCTAAYGETPSRPASPHSLARPFPWRPRPPGRTTAAAPHRCEAPTPRPPRLIPKPLPAKTSPNLRVRCRRLRRRALRHVAARSARGTTAPRYLCGSTSISVETPKIKSFCLKTELF